MIRMIALTLALFLLVPVGKHGPAEQFFVPAAFADDDDGDDGDDSDDGDDDDNGGGFGRGGGVGSAPSGGRGSQSQAGGSRSGTGAGNFLAPLRRLFGEPNRPAPQRRSAPVPPVLFVAGEIIVLNINSEDLQSLVDEGYRILEERSVANGQIYYRLAVPDGLPLPDARDAVRALPSGQDTDFNHYYRPEQGTSSCQVESCAAYTLVNWPDRSAEERPACTDVGSIGMIDTGINENHPVFEGAEMAVLRLADESLAPSKASHGTAVASIIVGQPGSRVQGLLPEARLVAVDAFHRSGRDERADAFTLVEALYNLTGENVTVINLSLAGPENSVVAAALRDITERQGIAVVAAAGNEGPNSDPVYPAAYEEVLAVTAVDRNKRVYRRANQGEYIDLAAPGVNVWTAASIRGAKWKTGTSYAVPFATAALALAKARHPEKTPKELYDLLKSNAEDLGKSGQDTVYGAGLLHAGGLC